MTDNQSNGLEMANVATSFLDKNTSIFATNVKLNTAITNAKTTISDINKVIITQASNTKGATENKHKLHNTAIEKAEHVCAGLIAYADDIDDTVLAAQIHFTHTHFAQGAPSTIIARMQTVYNTAKNLPAGTLTPFNVTALEISDLQTAINNFATAAPLKKTLTAITKAATKELIPLFTKLRSQLTKLDKLVNTYKSQQSTFVNGFHNARTIYNLGKSTKAEELQLMPHHFEAIFGMQFQEGDTFTIRNHSNIAIHAALSDVPNQMPTDIIVEIPANKEYKLSVAADFGGKFRHWLMIHNFNDLDDANVTTILAHGKSNSSAISPGQTA